VALPKRASELIHELKSYRFRLERSALESPLDQTRLDADRRDESEGTGRVLG
jgi:hypothetical protein